MGMIRPIAAFALLLAGCGPTAKLDATDRIAAFEVPLSSAQDRTDLAALVTKTAKDQGIDIQISKGSLDSNVYREDQGLGWSRMDSAAMVMDLGNRAWVIFLKGQDHAMAARYREQVVPKIKQRWPSTKSLPVSAQGPLPRVHP